MTRRAGLLAGILLGLASCGSPDAGPTTTQEEVTTTSDNAPTQAATPAGESSGVSAFQSELGSILVDPDGLTLYLFTPDDAGESTCYDSCAALWPPVAAETPIAGGLDPSVFGSAPRADGADQLTVRGWPLYRFASDVSPGDTTGQGVEGVWFVVGSDGEMITVSPSSDDTGGGGATIPDYGY